MRFRTILIANRGEISVRVIRTARALGYRTVAVYSEADAGAPHVSEADRAVCIGPPAVNQSYLDIARIVAAAKTAGADAIHPGYGFLSENEDFARACQDAGIVFIGPDPDAIELMGNKRAAKLAVAPAGVPVVPGYEGADQSDERLIAEAGRIGLPVMVKAAAGGGGRGMRLVHETAELAAAIRGARAEATSAFGSGELILERAVMNGRHVEIQVFGDRHGNAIHLGERDCSVQRRHQKIIEESPSPAVDQKLRNAMGGAAVAAAKACRYVGAGTVEFILAPNGDFYFLEMNTRLQVEHPVTEMVTGLDLVAWQIRVAAGEPLPLAQEEVTFSGHAIEVRLYAEDAARGFLPHTGVVRRWAAPEGAGLRVDAGIREGQEVSPHYDSMLAKLIAHGRTRDDARRQLVAALERTTLLGVTTNKNYLIEILDHPVFAAGGATTAFIGDHMHAAAERALQPPSDGLWALAALIRYLRGAAATCADADWIGWRSGGSIDTAVRLESGERRRHATIGARGRGRFGRLYQVAVAELTGQFPAETRSEHEIEVVACTPSQLVTMSGDLRTTLRYVDVDGTLYLDCDDGNRVIRDITATPPQAADAAGSGVIKAPLDGAVIGVFVAEGETVKKGQALVALEAMKMEHTLKADVDGVVRALRARKGEQVKVRQLLVEIAPAGAPVEA